MVFTADDPAYGWGGISLDATGAQVISYLAKVRVEHVNLYNVAVLATGTHTVSIDTAVFRRNGRAVALWSPDSRTAHSRVDTTLAAWYPAVVLASDATMSSTLVRGSSGPGVLLETATALIISCDVQGAASHGIEMNAAASARNCNLSGNGGAGVLNWSASTAGVEDLWWGAGTGPNTSGAATSLGPLDVVPWRTSPYTLPYVP